MTTKDKNRIFFGDEPNNPAPILRNPITSSPNIDERKKEEKEIKRGWGGGRRERYIQREMVPFLMSNFS